MPGFEKGHEKIGGRKKGEPNKFTCLKDWILEAATKTEAKKRLMDLSKGTKHDQKWFFELWAKLQPKEIKGDVDATVKIIMEKIITTEKPKDDRG
jgi:hypothetical protein